MANIRKSFNFRNGVQVDDDNFIVNANGLVGIGTSNPTEFLDVHGTAKITGLVTATNLARTRIFKSIIKFWFWSAAASAIFHFCWFWDVAAGAWTKTSAWSGSVDAGDFI